MNVSRRILEHAKQQRRISRVGASKILRAEAEAQRHTFHDRMRRERRFVHECQHRWPKLWHTPWKQVCAMQRQACLHTRIVAA